MKENDETTNTQAQGTNPGTQTDGEPAKAAAPAVNEPGVFAKVGQAVSNGWNNYWFGNVSRFDLVRNGLAILGVASIVKAVVDCVKGSKNNGGLALPDFGNDQDETDKDPLAYDASEVGGWTDTDDEDE